MRVKQFKPRPQNRMLEHFQVKGIFEIYETTMYISNKKQNLTSHKYSPCKTLRFRLRTGISWNSCVPDFHRWTFEAFLRGKPRPNDHNILQHRWAQHVRCVCLATKLEGWRCPWQRKKKGAILHLKPLDQPTNSRYTLCHTWMAMPKQGQINPPPNCTGSALRSMGSRTTPRSQYRYIPRVQVNSTFQVCWLAGFWSD